MTPEILKLPNISKQTVAGPLSGPDSSVEEILIGYTKRSINLGLRSPAPDIEATPDSRIASIEHKCNLIYDSCFRLTGKLKKEIPDPNMRHHIFSVLGLAASLLMYETQKGEDIVVKEGDFLVKLAICPDVNIKIGNISPADLSQKKDIKPADYFRASVEATLAMIDSSYDRFTKDNIGNQMFYGNSEKERQAISTVCDWFRSISFVDIKDFDILNSLGSENSGREIISKARGMVRAATGLKTAFLNEILCSNSKNFISNKNILEKYLDGSESEKRVALLRLGLDKIENLIFAYRSLRKLLKEGEKNLSFYEKLGNAIMELSKCFPNPPLTADDVEFFLNENADGKKTAVEFSELKDICREIIKYSGSQEYVVDSNQVNSSELKNPKNIKLKFNTRGNPNRFSISISFETDKAKTAELNFNIHAEDKIIDWPNFLEGSDDPQMTEMRDASMRYIKSILLTVRNNVLEEWKKRNNETNTPKVKRERMPREKVGRKRPQKPLTPIELSQNELDQTEKKREVKRETVFLDESICPRPHFIDEKRWKVLKKRIQRGIELKKIKPLTIKTKSGKNLYRLQVDKVLRFILINGSNGNEFKVIGALKRNDEYKELQGLSQQY